MLKFVIYYFVFIFYKAANGSNEDRGEVADEDKRIITDDEIISLSIEFFDQRYVLLSVFLRCHFVVQLIFTAQHTIFRDTFIFSVFISQLLTEHNSKAAQMRDKKKR